LADVIEHYRKTTGRDTVPLHDSLAVLEAAVPGTLRTTSMPLAVICDHGPTRGAVVTDSAQCTTRNVVQVALDADLPSINATILDRLRSLR
jgi:inosine-uridine nucleoside N-ribohydrolase